LTYPLHQLVNGDWKMVMAYLLRIRYVPWNPPAATSIASLVAVEKFIVFNWMYKFIYGLSLDNWYYKRFIIYHEDIS